MPDRIVKALDADTWPDFAALIERHNGIWGGCWCMAFHAEGFRRDRTAAENRTLKEARVRDGRAHAALVYAGAECIGWCQYGSAEELPRFSNRRAYLAAGAAPADWRITCFFTDKAHRREGVAGLALDGALEQIRALGGGTVESFPEDREGQKVSESFLHNGTLALFERHGFARDRRIGKHRWVVTRRLG